MRGPEGPVRGGVTRCGRPPPLCRGRGRGKTSRLPTPSSSSMVGEGQLDAPIDMPRDSISLRYRVGRDVAFLVRNDGMVSPRRTVRLPGRLLPTRTDKRLPRYLRLVNASCEEGRKRATTRKRDDEKKREDDEARRIPRCAARPNAGFRAAAWPAESSCWRSSALDASSRLAKLWRVLRSTASGPSRRGTASCVASRPDRRRLSRPTTGYRTPPRRSARCATCPRSPRHPGVAPSSPIPCRLPARSGHRNRMRACHGRGAPTSRD